jgi:hypothetical protein
VSPVLGVVVATLGVILLWGVFAPKSFWRLFASWSVSDPYANEPGATSYALRRLASALGVLSLAAVLAASGLHAIQQFPTPPAARSAVDIMWGAPDPQVVNRVVDGIPNPPTDLRAEPILGYQAFGSTGTPSYLTRLRIYNLLGKTDVPGLVGHAPDIDAFGIDSAKMIIHVRGPILCIPRAIVVVETDTTIKVGVYYGLPNSADGSPVDSLAGCPSDATLTASLLIPIQLSGPVGDREVDDLDGARLNVVHIPETGEKAPSGHG